MMAFVDSRPDGRPSRVLSGDAVPQPSAGRTGGSFGLRPQPRLVTPRLILRSPGAGDAAALAAGLSDPAVAAMIASIRLPVLAGDALDRILDWRDATRAGAAWVFGLETVRPGADGERPGLIGIVELARGADGVHLGYWLARPFWGRGLMGEAIGAVLPVLAEASPGLRVTSGVMADNPASLRLMDRFGFSIVGVSDVYAAARGRMVNVIDIERRL